MVYLLLKCDSLQASVGTHCVFPGPVVLSGGSTRCPMTVRELCAALTCRSPGSWSCTSWWHERYAAYDMRGFSRATTLSLCGFPGGGLGPAHPSLLLSCFLSLFFLSMNCQALLAASSEQPPGRQLGQQSDSSCLPPFSQFSQS